MGGVNGYPNNARYPDPGNEARKNRERDYRLARLERLMTQQPKFPTPAAGIVVGMAEVHSTSGTVLMPGGGGNLDYESVTYSSAYDPNAGTDGATTEPIGSWLTISGYQLTLSPGWYIPVLYVRVIWNSSADAPPAFGPYMQGGNDSVHNDYGIFPGTAYSSGRWGLVQTVNYGPTYMPNGNDLHVEVRPIGGAVGGDSNPSQSAIVWDITKLA